MASYALPVEAWERVAFGTENDRFKARYQQALTAALLISLGMWVNIFLFTPELEIEPYRLKEEVTEIIGIHPPVIVSPPPPREIPRPVELNPVPDSEIEQDVDIAPSIFDEMPVFDRPTSGGQAGRGFEAFDTKPALVKFVPPVYSEFAREAGFSGVVYVDVLVGTDGRVKQTRLQRGVHPLLDNSALAAAQRARFTPGRQRDIPVEVWVTLPYGFVLN